MLTIKILVVNIILYLYRINYRKITFSKGEHVMQNITFFLMYLTSHILLVIQETCLCACVSLDLTEWLSSFQKFKPMLLSCNVLQRNSKMVCLMIYNRNNVIDSQGDCFHLLKNCRCTYIHIHVYVVFSC